MVDKVCKTYLVVLFTLPFLIVLPIEPFSNETGLLALLVFSIPLSLIFTLWWYIDTRRRQYRSAYITKATLFIMFLMIVLTIVLSISQLNTNNQLISVWGDQQGLGRTFWTVALVPISTLLTLPLLSAYKDDIVTFLSAGLAAISVKSLVLVATFLFSPNLAESISTALNYQYHYSLAGIAAVALMLLVNRINKPLAAVCIVSNAGFLLFSPQIPWAVVIGGIIVIGVYGWHRSTRLMGTLLIFGAMILTAIVANWLNFVNYKLPVTGTELDHGTSINLTLSTLGYDLETLLWGKGLGGFAEAFNANRPVSFNYKDDWDKVYQSTSAQIWQDSIELGLVVTVTLLVAISAGLYFAKGYHTQAKGKESTLDIKLAGAVLLISYLFMIWQTGTLMSIFMLLVLLAAHQNSHIKIATKQIFVPVFLGLIPLIAGSLLLKADNPIYLLVNHIYAERQFYLGKQAVSLNNSSLAYTHFAAARKAIPQRAKYRAEFAKLSMVIGDLVLGKTTGIDQNLETLFAQSVKEIRTVTESIAPHNLLYWEARVNIYKELLDKYEGADQQVIATYKHLINISPSHAFYRYSLGVQYFELEMYSEAISTLNDAIRLKPDYYDAYLTRGKAYAFIGNTEEAKADFLFISQQMPQTETTYQLAAEELKNLLAKTAPVAKEKDTSNNTSKPNEETN